MIQQTEISLIDEINNQISEFKINKERKDEGDLNLISLIMFYI